MRWLSLLLLAGCATAPQTVTFDRCNTGRVIDGCSPADYPPLVSILPSWPFPVLYEEAAPAPPPKPETPGSRLIQKLTK